MKEVRVCEAMKSPVGTLSDGTVLHQQEGLSPDKFRSGRKAI